jgi:hypothetical protein
VRGKEVASLFLFRVCVFWLFKNFVPLQKSCRLLHVFRKKMMLKSSLNIQDSYFAFHNIIIEVES